MALVPAVGEDTVLVLEPEEEGRQAGQLEAVDSKVVVGCIPRVAGGMEPVPGAASLIEL